MGTQTCTCPLRLIAHWEERCGVAQRVGDGGREADPTPSSSLGDCELRSRGAALASRERIHHKAVLPGEGALGLRMEASSDTHGVSCSTPASDPALCGPCLGPVGGADKKSISPNADKAFWHGDLLCWHLAGVERREDGPTPVLYQNTLPFGHAKSSRSQLPVEFSGKSSRSPEGNTPPSFEHSTEGGTVSSSARQLLAGFVPLRLLARELPWFLAVWASP